MATKIKITILSLLFLVSWSSVKAQHRPLQVGDRLPDLVLSGLLGKTGETLKLRDLLQDRPLVIDFWATWCVPCVYEMRTMDSLTRSEYSTPQLLMVTMQDEKTIRKFFAGPERPDYRTSELKFLTGDSVLHKLFPHNTIPHNIWIGKDGVIKAITGIEEMRPENLLAFSKTGQAPAMRQKKDNLSFEKSAEFHLGDTLFSYRSILTPYISGINGGQAAVYYNGKAQRFFQWNGSITHLFWNAYSGFSPDIRYGLIRLKTRDSLKLLYPEGSNRHLLAGSRYRDYTEWTEHNTYCYALTLPEKVGIDTFGTYMIADLNRNFRSYHGEIIKEKILCNLVTGAPSKHIIYEGTDSISTIKLLPGYVVSIKRSTMEDICNWLSRRFPERSFPEPFLVRLGRHQKTRFNIELDLAGHVKANNGKMKPEFFYEALEKLGFRFRKQLKPYPVLVICDR